MWQVGNREDVTKTLQMLGSDKARLTCASLHIVDSLISQSHTSCLSQPPDRRSYRQTLDLVRPSARQCSHSSSSAIAAAAMQPWQKRHCSSCSSAAAAAQLLQLSSSSSSAFTARQQQQLSFYSSAAAAAQQVAALPAQIAMQPCSHAAVQPCSLAALQPLSLAMQPQSSALQPCSHAAVQPCGRAAVQPLPSAVQPLSSVLQHCSHAALFISLATLQLQSTALQPGSLAAPIYSLAGPFNSPVQLVDQAAAMYLLGSKSQPCSLEVDSSQLQPHTRCTNQTSDSFLQC